MTDRTRDISNNADVIDSRDIIARIEELEGERDDAQTVCDRCDATGEVANDDGDDRQCQDCGGLGYTSVSAKDYDEENPEGAAELLALLALAEEAEGYAADWQYGETLIRDSYFVDYARELLEDCGTIPKDLPHYIHIDWEATVRDIRMDYTAVDFDGVTYWVR